MDERVSENLENIIKGKLLICYHKRRHICTMYITIQMYKKLYIVSTWELPLVLGPHDNRLGGRRKPKSTDSESLHLFQFKTISF